MIRPRGTLFFPPQKRTRFTTPPNSQWLAFCSGTRTNLPQHEHENRTAFFTVLGEASELDPSASNRVPHTTLFSPEPFDLTLIHHSPQGRGLLVVIPGGRVFTCLEHLAQLLLFLGHDSFLSPVL